MKKIAIIAGILVLLALSGCASYTPATVKTQATAPTTAKVVQSGVTLYVEEYGSTEKAAKAFDANLVEDGVLPLFVTLLNESGKTLLVDLNAISLRDETGLLKQLTTEEAALKAKKNAWGRAIGWSMIVPIISIPIAATASVMHTNKVNRQMQEDFTAKALTTAPLPMNKEVSGFLFFEVDKIRSKWNGMMLDINAKFEGDAGGVALSTPLPEVKVKVADAPKSDKVEPNPLAK